MKVVARHCFPGCLLQQLAELRFVVSSLADPAKRNAELGYYIATFEAALQHLQEMNVAEARRGCQKPGVARTSGRVTPSRREQSAPSGQGVQ